MKIVILIVLLARSVCGAEFQKFLWALNHVEASGQHVNVVPGDGGAAIGPFQIHRVYWLDSKVAGSYTQCTNYDYSVKVVTAYLNRYCHSAVAARDWETCARIHNGGPAGASKKVTLSYWKKVKRYL